MKKENESNKKKEQKDLHGLQKLIHTLTIESLYRYIYEESLSSGKAEIQVIKDLLVIDIGKFHSSYRKWKERYKAKQNKQKQAGENKKDGICERR